MIRKGQILLVDDDEAILEIHSAHLMKAGYEVAITNNGFEALRKLSLKKYDLIIADYIMPAMDGIQFAQYVKVNSLNESTPLFILSGHLSNQIIDTFKNVGVLKFISKPCSIEDLLRNVKNQIQPSTIIANYTQEMMDFFRKSIIATFSQYFPGKVSVAKHEIIKTSAALCHYSSAIPYFGKNIFGYSAIYSDRAVLKSVCQKAFGTSENDFGEPTYLDILGESNNQILGNLKHLLQEIEVDLIIGLPVSLAGYPKNISLLPTFPRIIFDVKIDENKLFVEYCMCDPSKIENLQSGTELRVFDYKK